MFLRQDGVLTMEIVFPRQLRSVVGVGVGEVSMVYLCQTGILPLKIARLKRLRWGLCVWDFYGGDCALGRLRWGLCVGTFTMGIVRWDIYGGDCAFGAFTVDVDAGDGVCIGLVNK